MVCWSRKYELRCSLLVGSGPSLLVDRLRVVLAILRRQGFYAYCNRYRRIILPKLKPRQASTDFFLLGTESRTGALDTSISWYKNELHLIMLKPARSVQTVP